MSLLETLNKSVDLFSQNSDSVKELMEFDQYVLDITIRHIDQLQSDLTRGGHTGPAQRVSTTLKLVTDIKAHNSLEIKFQTIFNQCLVLLVSHFGACLKEIFVKSLSHAIAIGTIKSVNEEEIKISLGELQNVSTNPLDAIGEVLIEQQKDISFQDMQSINRTFNKYFECSQIINEDTSNIILGHACRHNIVHNGAIIDGRTLKQLQMAKNRTVKTRLLEGESLSFTPQEVIQIEKSMVAFTKALVNNLSKNLDK